MSGGDVYFLAIAGFSAFCAVLLGSKLWRMLFRPGPYWAGGSPWYVDKQASPGEHAFFVSVVGVGFVIAAGMTTLFVLAALSTYF